MRIKGILSGVLHCDKYAIFIEIDAALV